MFTGIITAIGRVRSITPATTIMSSRLHFLFMKNPRARESFKLGRGGKTSRFMFSYLARRIAWSIVGVR